MFSLGYRGLTAVAAVGAGNQARLFGFSTPVSTPCHDSCHDSQDSLSCHDAPLIGRASRQGRVQYLHLNVRSVIFPTIPIDETGTAGSGKMMNHATIPARP